MSKPTKVSSAKAMVALGSVFDLGTKRVEIVPKLWQEGWMVDIYHIRRLKGRHEQRVHLGGSECPFENLDDAINSALAEVGGWRKDA